MGCPRIINYLQMLRTEINETQLDVENGNSIFALFTKNSNGDMLYWSALTFLLKEGGFSEDEVRTAYAQLIEKVSDARGEETTDAIQQRVVSLTDMAIMEVFRMNVTQEALGVAEALPIARDPLAYIRTLKEKNLQASRAIKDLRTCRYRIGAYMRTVPNAQVGEVHEDFVTMYNSDDSDVSFYTALFSLLKQGGYTKSEVVAATMDRLVLPRKMQNTGVFIKLCNEAISQVYEKDE